MNYRQSFQTTLRPAALLGLIAVGMLMGSCNTNPGLTDQTPLYRPPGNGGPTSGERGSVMITEINWAGSVENDGTYHPDDVFIELQSREERQINLTGWQLQVRGDVNHTYVIPEVDSISTNEYFVIAAKRNGAFSKEADLILENLELGKQHTYVKLVDVDERLMGSAGSEERRNFTGGWDTVSVRSMERVQLLFTNSGTQSRSWHAYSADQGFETINEGWRKYTLASPGEANSTDYSGSTSTGSFE